MAIDNGRRVIDQDASLVIYPEDSILIDSPTNGTRQITYESLCQAVANTLGIDAIKKTADGSMQKSTYDKDGDNIVDDAKKLDGKSLEYFATSDDLKAVKKTADGSMQKSTYDSNGSGVVDNAEKVNTHTVESDVPANAKFTDTVYDDTNIKKAVEKNTQDIKTLQNGVVGLSVKDGKIIQTIIT